MTRSTIGGRLNLAALAALAGADRRPRENPRPDRDTCRVAAVEMRQRGLTVADIAQALSISDGAVRQLLGESLPITNRRDVP